MRGRDGVEVDGGHILEETALVQNALGRVSDLVSPCCHDERGGYTPNNISSNESSETVARH